MLDPYLYHTQPQQLMGYADASTKIPSIAWKLAKTNEQKRKLEHVWAQYPEWAHRYARDIVRKPWPPGEAAIASVPYLAYLYARTVIKGPWPPGEAAIAGNAGLAYLYALEVIEKPWPPGEAAIAGSAGSAFLYALDVIGKRWPPGEAAIAGDAKWAQEYQKEFKVNLRAGQ